MSTLRFIFYPFTHRIQKGEGGLVLFNVLHSAFAYPDEWRRVFAESIVALMTLIALYGFNDYVDRERDLNNKKKNQDFSLAIVNGHRQFLLINLSLSAVVVVMCALMSGTVKSGILIMLLAINMAYSLRLKSLPVLDIVAVVLWGGLFVGISGKPNPWLVMSAALMTGMAHVFQILTDRGADIETGVRTSVTAKPDNALKILWVLSGLLGAVLFYMGIGWWGLLCLIPPLAHILLNNVTTAWYASRGAFFVLWVVSLTLIYG